MDMTVLMDWHACRTDARWPIAQDLGQTLRAFGPTGCPHITQARRLEKKESFGWVKRKRYPQSITSAERDASEAAVRAPSHGTGPPAGLAAYSIDMQQPHAPSSL